MLSRTRHREQTPIRRNPNATDACTKTDGDTRRLVCLRLADPPERAKDDATLSVREDPVPIATTRPLDNHDWFRVSDLEEQMK